MFVHPRTEGPAHGPASNETDREKASHPMAIRIKARNNESVQQMMRRFKKLCEKEGLNKDVKRKQYYEKPSERRNRAARKSLKRRERTV
jgi:small subunit ribosomal protein S21